MTKKRFTVLKKIENSDIEADVIDTYIEKLVKDGKSVGWVTVGILNNGNPITYKDCVDLLNEQHEEIQNLKQENQQLIACKEFCNSLKEENEQLKQQLNRLYNYFEDWYSDMTSANDFSEIWDNVKEDERWGDVE